MYVLFSNKKTLKGKAVPQHRFGGAGGKRMYSSYSFTTSILDGGEWSAPRSGHALPPGKANGQEANWVTLASNKKPLEWLNFSKLMLNIHSDL
jgi:hypothetical protein